jgi:phage-related protein
MNAGENMPSKWIVESYVDKDSRKPVEDYIYEGNDEDVVALLINVIQRLQALGPDLQGTNMDKLIDGPIRELRKKRHRILYGRVGNRFVLLSAFMKKTDKTPPEQISLAKSRFEDYKRKNS